jgi:ribonuclease PH
MQADGGTRTASICGAYVALVDAVRKLPREVPAPKLLAPGAPLPARFDPQHYDPAHAIITELAAVSVGLIDDEIRLDLDYEDDSRALVDMNVAYTAAGRFVEVQGSAENAGGFDRDQTNRMLDLAVAGCEKIMQFQRESLKNL